MFQGLQGARNDACTLAPAKFAFLQLSCTRSGWDLGAGVPWASCLDSVRAECRDLQVDVETSGEMC